MGFRVKRYEFFTREQQDAYEALTEKQRKYVDARGLGYTKANSYRMAGYDSRVPAQAAYLLEKNCKVIPDLIKLIEADVKARSLIEDEKSTLNQTVNALAAQEGAEKIIEKVEGADSETAKRIQFYRDVLSGKIKTIKKTKRFGANGRLLDTKVEEVQDVDIKMRARRELDRLLGLNDVIDLEKLQFGGITVNIVDASKRDEASDPRNKIDIAPKEVEEVETEAAEVEEDGGGSDE